MLYKYTKVYRFDYGVKKEISPTILKKILWKIRKNVNDCHFTTKSGYICWDNGMMPNENVISLEIFSCKIEFSEYLYPKILHTVMWYARENIVGW